MRRTGPWYCVGLQSVKGQGTGIDASAEDSLGKGNKVLKVEFCFVLFYFNYTVSLMLLYLFLLVHYNYT